MLYIVSFSIDSDKTFCYISPRFYYADVYYITAPPYDINEITPFADMFSYAVDQEIDFACIHDTSFTECAFFG